MEFDLIYKIEQINSIVDFQYEEYINTNHVIFEYIGSSLFDVAVFKSNKFFEVKDYDNRYCDVTPLSIRRTIEAKEHDTITFASIVNTRSTVKLNSVIIDDSIKDTVENELTLFNRKNGIYTELNKGTIVTTNKYAVLNENLEVDIHRCVDTKENYMVGFKLPKVKQFEVHDTSVYITNSTSRRKNSFLIENLYASFIKELRIRNFEKPVDIRRTRYANKNDTLFISRPKWYFDTSINNILETTVKPIDNNIIETINFDRYTRLDTTINKNIYASIEDRNIDIGSMLIIKPNDKKLFKNKDIDISKRTGSLNVNELIDLTNRKSGLFKSENVKIDMTNKGIGIDNNAKNFSDRVSYGNIQEGNWFNLDPRDSFYVKDISVGKYADGNKIFISNKLIGFDYIEKLISSIDYKFFTKQILKGRKYSTLGSKSISFLIDRKDLRYENIIGAINFKSGSMSYSYNSNFINKIEKDRKNTGANTSVFAYKDSNYLYTDIGIVGTTFKENELTIYKDYRIKALKNEKDTNIDRYFEFINRDSYNLYIYEGKAMFDKISQEFHIYNSKFASKTCKDIKIALNNIFVYNNPSSSWYKDVSLSLDKGKNEITLQEFTQFLDKVPQGTYIYKGDEWFNKGGLGYSEGNKTIYVSKRPISMEFGNEDLFLAKRENAIGVVKGIMNFSKNSWDINDEYYVVNFDSSVKDINFDDYSRTFESKVLGILIHDSTVSISNTVKSIGILDTTKSISDVTKRIAIYNKQIRLSSVVKDISTNDTTVVVDSSVKGITELIQGTLVKDYKDMLLYNQYTHIGAKTIPNCSILSDQIGIDTTRISIKLFKPQERIEVIKVLNIESNLFVEKELEDTFYNYNGEKYFLSKEKIKTMIPLLERMEQDKVLKDIILDQDEWLYDNTPHNNLDLTAGGIDELLLPQEDFDYAQFKDGLIDSVTHEPISPVRKLSDGSFIAKRPINHPLPEYKDIAKDYLQVNVSLLRHMMETFYKIWQGNMFKFGALDMRSAVAKMIEYMDAYVDFNIPTDLIPQAKRVIRLIRWYGEASIMKHAEYKIKYLYEPMKSELFTGHCNIPNIMNNMFVDATKCSITNSVVNQDAWVEFEINNPIDTKVSFMAYIDNEGQLDVYVNDSLEATYTIQRISAKIDIVAAATQKNKIKLFFKSINNGIINIANVVITDMVYSDIITEYSPVVGSGNKVLDELVKRVTIYGELYQNSQEFITNTINGNLAITDLIDKLNEYFYLHHDRKTKGKRKVTKK